MPSLIATAQAYLSALGALDSTRLLTLLGSQYKHTFAPTSLDFGRPVDRETFVARFAELRPVVESMAVEILRSWPSDEAEQGRTITVYAAIEPRFRDSVQRKGEDAKGEWNFQGEYVFVLTVDESGEKVVEALEFVEGRVADRMRAQIGKAFQRISSGDE